MPSSNSGPARFQRRLRFAHKRCHHPALEIDPLLTVVVVDPGRPCSNRVQPRRWHDAGRICKALKRHIVEARIRRAGPSQSKLDLPVERPADEIEKQTIDLVCAADGTDERQDCLPVSQIGRGNADIPFHLRSPFTQFEDRPELRPRRQSSEIRRMIGKAGDAGVEAEAKLMHGIDRGRIMSRSR